MKCLVFNSRENFEDKGKRIRSRMEQEENPVIRKLLQQDVSLDRMQVQMATAREFLITVSACVTRRNQKFNPIFHASKNL